MTTNNLTLIFNNDLVSGSYTNYFQVTFDITKKKILDIQGIDGEENKQKYITQRGSNLSIPADMYNGYFTYPVSYEIWADNLPKEKEKIKLIIPVVIYDDKYILYDDHGILKISDFSTHQYKLSKELFDEMSSEGFDHSILEGASIFEISKNYEEFLMKKYS
jgi:hypothetical protein